MKFINYPVQVDAKSQYWIKPDIMVTETTKMCLTCCRPTVYLEVCSESYFCSDECVDEFYKQVAAFEQID